MKTWTASVRNTYETVSELRAYNRIYGIARRCGYRSCAALWRDNPVIGGSVEPADFGRVKIIDEKEATE